MTTDLKTTSEWATYRAMPDHGSFVALLGRAGGPTNELLRCLSEQAAETPQWRVCQHASIVFEKRGIATEAQYYAAKAIEYSGGHVLAHVALARALELRRFPGAVLHQLDEIRLREPMLGRTPQRQRVRAYVASALVRNYCYMGSVAAVRPWIEFLKHTSFAESDAWVQLLHAASFNGSEELQFLAARRITHANPPRSGRAEGRLLHAWRHMLVRALARRE